jgi:hypothetical protein
LTKLCEQNKEGKKDEPESKSYLLSVYRFRSLYSVGNGLATLGGTARAGAVATATYSYSDASATVTAATAACTWAARWAD